MIRKALCSFLFSGALALPMAAQAQVQTSTNPADSAAWGVADGNLHTLLGFTVTSTAGPGFVMLTSLAAEPSSGSAITPVSCWATGPIPTGGLATSFTLANLPVAGVMPNIMILYSSTGCRVYTPKATGTLIAISYQ